MTIVHTWIGREGEREGGRVGGSHEPDIFSPNHVVIFTLV